MTQKIASLFGFKARKEVVEATPQVTVNGGKTIRLFSVEGPELSHKAKGEYQRMVWYTKPSTAIKMRSVNPSTGRLVYIDLDLNLYNSFRREHFSFGDYGVVLTGRIVTTMKNRWKYADERVIAQSELEVAHKQIAVASEV